MSNAATQAYARVANTSATPRELEAQALLMAANKLQEVVSNANLPPERRMHALMFNRKLWSVFLGDALSEGNLQPLDVRQKIVDISMFVLTQTLVLQNHPQIDEFKSLIEINRNIAAGLSGRA
jgi:flagellar protein FlaF